MTNSSDYEPTRHDKTIVNASQMFKEVHEEAEQKRNVKSALDVPEKNVE